MQTFSSMPGPQPLPPPIKDTSEKLVNDFAHPFKPLRPHDIRGPCPGLNTLASHGYLPRSGVVTPAQIITAVQEGYNLGHQFASFLCYTAFLTDGNHLTNLMTIGQNTTTHGHPTTGLNTHGHFEGDASMSRDDAYLGNNINFNETLFDAVCTSYRLSKLQQTAVGGGLLTLDAIVLNRQIRIQDSIARNPQFAFETPRFLGAIAESAFIFAMFVSGQTADNKKPLTIDAVRHFFDFHRLPHGFHRRQGPFDFPLVENLTYSIVDMAGAKPGSNNGVNNYIVNTQDLGTFCYVYQKQINFTATLYPNPTPKLRDAIKQNMLTYYQALGDPKCKQYFPFGK
ncbi:heme-thiolate peroxidase [Boletus reticuloceps]|uniref:Heme-thiolate peroxidase n=1 Tax=Boletus reticuloceps TaxID=495285 RepID=A0A8I2YL70_9AGAM|nr:heme-thiolate peroxidase [Boletus reticuloceps]